MVTRTVQLLNGFVAFGRPLGAGWSLEEVARFNHTVARHLSHVVWIPEHAGPLEVESLEPDRVLPSVDTALQQDLLG
jgi:hypothetical protein